MDKPEILICTCNSVEHQIIFTYDEEDNVAYCSIHLLSQGFWKRLIHGIKYIFGHRSIYGAWDEIILNKKHADQILMLGNKLKEGK